MAVKNERKMLKTAEILANNPTMATSKAMVLGGYSPAYANNPGKLTEQDRWIKLMKTKWPDKKLANKVNELLDAAKVTKRFVSGKQVEEITQIDTFAINAGLTHAFKLKNKYPAEKHEVAHKFPIPLLDLTNQVKQEQEHQQQLRESS